MLLKIDEYNTDGYDDDKKNQDKRLKGLLMGHRSSFAKKKRRAAAAPRTRVKKKGLRWWTGLRRGRDGEEHERRC